MRPARIKAPMAIVIGLGHWCITQNAAAIMAQLIKSMRAAAQSLFSLSDLISSMVR